MSNQNLNYLACALIVLVGVIAILLILHIFRINQIARAEYQKDKAEFEADRKRVKDSIARGCGQTSGNIFGREEKL